MKGKKADSKLLSIWWFAILLLIAVDFIIVVLAFYPDKLDLRVAESTILSTRIADCISENGKISQGLMQNNFDLKSICGFNDFIDEKGALFYVKVIISQGLETKKYEYGNSAFDKDCEIGNTIKGASSYPKCTEKNLEFLDKDNQVAKVYIKTGSNNGYRLS